MSKAKNWAEKTKTNFSKLPERKKNASLAKHAFMLGRLCAYEEAGLDKIAARVLPIAVGMGLAATAGALAARTTETEQRSRDIASLMRMQMTTLPEPLLTEIMMRGMSPSMAQHLLSAAPPETK